MALNDEIKTIAQGGLDTDSAPEYVAPNDFIFAQNMRNTGTAGQQLGFGTNIESNIALSGSLLPGINDVIGGGKFDDTGQILGFRYNSAGNCQMILYNSATRSYEVIFTDITDSAGATLLPLNPQDIVTAILVNKTYAVWWAKNLEVGYTNLTTLASGGYGTVLWEDLSLLKPQCLPPPTGKFGSDEGTPANDLYSNLGQFSVQYVNDDFNYSSWSTWSKRLTPYQENTPTLGSDVSQNNYIVVTVNIGSIRASIVNIACRFGLNIFYNIKSVTRAYILALPNSVVDVDTEVYEAYDAGANTYSFAFYNNTTNIPIATQETNLNYDYIWPANAGALVNGNIVGLGDWSTLYARPDTSVTVSAIGYNPNIGIPAGTYPDPLRKTGQFVGASGSGAGDHRRRMSVSMGGTPHTGDTVIIIISDIRNASSTINVTYPVPSAQDGDLFAVVNSVNEIISSVIGPSNYVLNGDGTYTITFVGPPYFGLSNYSINLFFSGATVANSIPSIPDNSQGQLSLSYRDYKGRFLPLSTDNSYRWASPSYAQVNGNAIELQWTINVPQAPEGAVDYQWLITAPQVLKIVDTIATLLIYKGPWSAKDNIPPLAINSGNVGDTYQVTTPCAPTDTAHYTNLGTNETYNTGDYVTDNALSYDLLPKSFGELTNQSILAFSLNSLNLYNSTYQQEGVDTILAYDFTPGDRCTLHYWIGNAGAIESFTITPGSGYTDGVYTGVALTGGTGTGAIAQVTVAGGVVTAVTLTNPGTGYVVTDSLTGTVTGGTGWAIVVTVLVTSGTNFFNQPCIDLSVLGYDAGNYILKVENSAALVYSGGHITYNGSQIDTRNIFLRLYTPALQNQTSQTAAQSTTLWYEIGERFTITNGLHDVLTGTITDGGVYYKTRQFLDAIQPYQKPPVDVLATDLNYSDFYASAFWSNGRARSYYDELEKTTQAASIITSQNYITGSKNNGLNRFYPSTIYGESDGQTSSSQDEIQIMWQRGQQLVIVQGLGVFYIPVNEAYTVVNDTLTGQSISSKLLNNGRYASENVGIGTAKESFCTRYDRAYFISPQNSQPYEIDVEAGIRPYSAKMSKFFKSTIQLAFQQGKKLSQFYNEYYEEVFMYIQSQSDILVAFPYSLLNWNPSDSFVVVPGDITPSNGSHSTVSYDSTTGIATYTPATNYVGTDTAPFSFLTHTKNVCLQWTAGSGTVNPFSFAPLVGVPLSTVEVSNTILVGGNDYPVAISITGDTGLGYSINGGAFTSSAGTVNSGDTVQVRVTSSGSNTTLTSCTLTIDGQSATFDVTTQAAGNFTAYAQYNGVIDSIVPMTGSGVPAGFAPCNLSSGQAKTAAYTTLTAGTYNMIMDGSPAIPGHVYVVLTVNGVIADQKLFTGPGSYVLTLGTTANDPDVVFFTLITHS